MCLNQRIGDTEKISYEKPICTLQPVKANESKLLNEMFKQIYLCFYGVNIA